MLKLGRSKGVRGERTEHTQLFSRTFAGSGPTGRQKVHFSTFSVSWHFKVVEMAFKTIHFVQGLSRTPLLFIPRYLTNIIFEHIKEKLENRTSENLKFRKPRFTNKCLGFCIFLIQYVYNEHNCFVGFCNFGNNSSIYPLSACLGPHWLTGFIWTYNSFGLECGMHLWGSNSSRMDVHE